MEKINVLFVALVIVVLIFAVYISYLKAKTDFLMNIINIHTDTLNGLVEIVDSQRILLAKQKEINDTLIKSNNIQLKFNNKFSKYIQDEVAHSPSSTGGRRSEAEA